MEDAGMIRNMAVPDRRIERDFCRLCKSPLRFDTGMYGQSTEACSNPKCSDSTPHPLRPTMTTAAPTAAERADKRKAARGFPPGRRGNPAWRKD